VFGRERLGSRVAWRGTRAGRLDRGDQARQPADGLRGAGEIWLRTRRGTLLELAVGLGVTPLPARTVIVWPRT
jgi:hypothetical protein